MMIGVYAYPDDYILKFSRFHQRCPGLRFLGCARCGQVFDM